MFDIFDEPTTTIETDEIIIFVRLFKARIVAERSNA